MVKALSYCVSDKRLPPGAQRFLGNATRQGTQGMTMDNIVTAPPEWETWEMELIERLHTAAYAAEQICIEDKRRVDEMKACLKAAQRELRTAERNAKKSASQFHKLFAQVWNLAKRHNVTSIRYDGGSHTSRASIG